MSPTAGGTINWEPPAYSPGHGPLLRPERNGYSIFYLTDPDPRGSMGLGGKEEVNVGNAGNFLTAIDLQDRQDRVAATYPAAAAAVAAAACWRPPADWCSAATPAATSSPRTRPPASRSGTRTSAT